MLETVFVVIVTYNGQHFIDACLDSVFKSDYPVNVIVVDNSSNDGTVDLIMRKYPLTTLIKNETNKGFGGANNQGIRLALQSNARYFFLLNQDTVILPNTISILMGAMSKRKEFGVVSPIHLNGTGDRLDRAVGNYVGFDISEEQLSSIHHLQDRHVLPVSFVNAAAWMVSVDTFKTIGGFAPLFFHYGEDRDFVYRLHFFHMKIAVITGAFIRHIREGREGMNRWNQERYNKYYKIGWISRASNVNRSFFSGWMDGLVWVSKEAISNLLKGNPKVLVAFFVSMGSVCSLIDSIRQHREEVTSSVDFKFLA